MTRIEEVCPILTKKDHKDENIEIVSSYDNALITRGLARIFCITLHTPYASTQYSQFKNYDKLKKRCYEKRYNAVDDIIHLTYQQIFEKYSEKNDIDNTINFTKQFEYRFLSRFASEFNCSILLSTIILLFPKGPFIQI